MAVKKWKATDPKEQENSALSIDAICNSICTAKLNKFSKNSKMEFSSIFFKSVSRNSFLLHRKLDLNAVNLSLKSQVNPYDRFRAIDGQSGNGPHFQ
jgi:hypothetical protein